MGLELLDWLRVRTLPEEARLADPDYAGALASDFVRGPRGQRHDHGARVRIPLRGGPGAVLRRGRAQRSADREWPGGLRPRSASRAAPRPPTPPTTPASTWPALARPRPAALRSHAALLDLLLGADARVVRGARRVGRRTRDDPHQRERRRDRGGADWFPWAATTWRPTSTTGWSARACSPTTCTSPTASSPAWRQRGPASRTARRATPSSAAASSRCAGTSTPAFASGSAPTSAPAPASAC